MILALLVGLCDISSGITWQNSASLPIPIQGAAVGSNEDNSQIYLISGYTVQGHAIHPIYQFDGNSFTLIGNFTFYVINGYDFILCTTVNNILFFLSHQHTIGYNTSSLEIEYKINNQINNPFCITSNNTHLFYVITNGSANNLYNILYAYNIDTQTWSDDNTFAPGQWWGGYGGTCICYNYKFYIFGGMFTSTPHALPDTAGHEIMMYCFTSNKWSLLPVNLKNSAVGLSVIMPQNDGIMYILGGNWLDDQDGAVQPTYNSVVKFDANLAKITAVKPLNTARTYPMVAAMNGRIYVIGGMGDTTYNYENISTTVLQSTEMSNIILPTKPPTITPTKPTMNPTSSPTNSPTKPTMNPTSSPTNSPTNSPTKPTLHPTNAPTKSPIVPTMKPIAADVVALTEQQLIECICVIVGVMLLFCMVLRCYKKYKRSQNVQDDVSFDGAGNLNEYTEGVSGRNILDTFVN